MGFKSIVIIKNLIFKLGFSHRVLYSITNNLLLVYEHKHLFKINTRSLNLIKNIIYILETIKLPVAYKIKGLFIKGYFQKLKISSKKSKF
jgi:ribosomal protein L6P/L9E